MELKDVKTEKILLAAVGVLILVLFTTTVSRDIVNTQVSLAEEQSSPSSGNDSDNDEPSEPSAPSSDENSEVSTPSTASVPSVKSFQGTGLTGQELSDQSADEASQDEVSEVSQVSEASEQEMSEVSSVEGYDEVVSVEGNVVVVKNEERLFFVIPVDVESEVTLDEQGNVVNVEQGFIDWLLSIFSF